MPGRRIPPELCARCKGYKRLCGLPRCPILSRFQAQVYAASRVTGLEVEGDSPPSLLVGEEGYPRVRVVYQVPPGVRGWEARSHDDPRGWAEKRVRLDVILEARSRLLGGAERLDARNPWLLYEKEVSLAAVSERPVGSELRLAKRPLPRLVFDGLTAPRGPVAPAREIRVEDNPRVPRPLEKLVFDDALAEEAVWEAYRSGVDYYALIRAFSAGLLGRLRNRRLVPTRWAITAVDSIISRRLRSLLTGLREIDSVEVYKAYYLGNRFVVVLYPGPPRVDMVEVWHPSTPWVRGSKPVATLVYEKPSGEPSEMDGGYMAARVAVLEALAARRRSASALVIREILPEYYAPVGNWHIRETLRQGLGSLVSSHDTLAEAIENAVKHLDARRVTEEVIRKWFVRRGAQRRLDEWLTR